MWVDDVVYEVELRDRVTRLETLFEAYAATWDRRHKELREQIKAGNDETSKRLDDMDTKMVLLLERTARLDERHPNIDARSTGISATIASAVALAAGVMVKLFGG